MISTTVKQMPGRRPAPRPPVRRPPQSGNAWDDVDRTILASLADHPRTLNKITAAVALSPGLVKDQLIAYASRGLVAKDELTGRYELTSTGEARLAALAPASA